ncbi:MAG: regulator of G-protein signaling domain-containing protein [archaeon]|nr:regulator of G-protein signaling domain-containing protein [archaeon]
MSAELEDSLGSYESSHSAADGKKGHSAPMPSWVQEEACGIGLFAQSALGGKVAKAPAARGPGPKKAKGGVLSGCLSSSKQTAQDPELSASASDSTESVSAQEDADRVPLMAKKYPLATVLAHPDALPYFREFSSKTHSVDSLNLWGELESYRSLEDANKKVNLFHSAVETYLLPGAPHLVASFTFAQNSQALSVHQQVCDAPHITEQLILVVDQCTHDLQYELEITDLMEVYIRFVRTKNFDRMIKACNLPIKHIPSS